MSVYEKRVRKLENSISNDEKMIRYSDIPPEDRKVLQEVGRRLADWVNDETIRGKSREEIKSLYAHQIKLILGQIQNEDEHIVKSTKPTVNSDLIQGASDHEKAQPSQ